MTKERIIALLELIEEITSGDEAWPAKAGAIESLATEDQRTAVNEFCSWFSDSHGRAL